MLCACRNYSLAWWNVMGAESGLGSSWRACGWQGLGRAGTSVGHKAMEPTLQYSHFPQENLCRLATLWGFYLGGKLAISLYLPFKLSFASLAIDSGHSSRALGRTGKQNLSMHFPLSSDICSVLIGMIIIPLIKTRTIKKRPAMVQTNEKTSLLS